MKITTGCFFLHIFLISTGCSQTNKIEKGYAYERSTLSGIKPKVSVAEDGTILQINSKPGVQYFIYVQTKNIVLPQVKNIRIKGMHYDAFVEAVNDVPVVVKNNSVEKYDTLVTGARFKTWKINVTQILADQDTMFTESTQREEEPEVLITFLFKDKIYYYPIAKIKFLEPVRLQ